MRRSIVRVHTFTAGLHRLWRPTRGTSISANKPMLRENLGHRHRLCYRPSLSRVARPVALLTYDFTVAYITGTGSILCGVSAQRRLLLRPFHSLQIVLSMHGLWGCMKCSMLDWKQLVVRYMLHARNGLDLTGFLLVSPRLELRAVQPWRPERMEWTRPVMSCATRAN